jgi:protein arginine phosphatase
MRVLFVCTGNIVRSVIAGALLPVRAKEILGRDGVFQSRSCGLSADHGRQPHDLTVEALKNLQIETDGITSTLLDGQQLAWADLVITMTRQQSYILANRYGDCAGRCFSLIEVNGALETLLNWRGISAEGLERLVDIARELGVDEIRTRMRCSLESLLEAPRAKLRPIAGVPLGIRDLLTLFPACFHQVSGIHDPLGGTADDVHECAAKIDSEIVMMVRSLAALAMANGESS